MLRDGACSAEGRSIKSSGGNRGSMAGFSVGDPADPKTAVGPWCHETYAQLQSYIRRQSMKARSSRRVRVIRKVRGGYFSTPTVFCHGRTIWQSPKRRFSVPAVRLSAYDFPRGEAIRIANDSKYGSPPAFLGTDLARAPRVGFADTCPGAVVSTTLWIYLTGALGRIQSNISGFGREMSVSASRVPRKPALILE